ncbi:glycosyltransferase family 4 protein [Rhodococcus sp. NPDC003322]
MVSAASWCDRDLIGGDAVWLPTPVTDTLERDRRVGPVSNGGCTYGMLANFDYPPNRDAYVRLVKQWLPVLRPLERRVVVAGFGSESLPRVDGVDVWGPVDTVSRFYDAVDAVFAPIELGGGMKVKVVEAMMHGVPVVATEHARGGLPPAIAGACIRWGRRPFVLRDPRCDEAVVDELRDFTFERFQRRLGALWRDRMGAG